MATTATVAVLVAQALEQPVFRSGVEVVEITVVARDGDGRLVTDLAQRDFQIVEEGQRQDIVAFERVSLPVTPPPEASAAPAGPTADVSSNDLGSGARLFVLVLDSLHVDARRTRDVRRIAAMFVERHIGPHDLAAVLSPGARDEATQEFTSDKARLLAAIANFGGQKLLSATLSRDEQSRKAGGGDMYEGRDPDDGERAYRARSVTNVLDALAKHLAGVERRRKALLLFSEGIDYNTEDIFGTAQRYSSEIAKAMDHSMAALARANVAVYALDPRGLTNAEGDLVERPIYQEVPPVALSEPGVGGELAASLRGLRTLSDATGGFAVTDTNSFEGAFDRIVRENSEYYVLGYQPTRPVRSGEFRKVEVRTSRPGLRLIARKGYTALPARARTAAASAASPEPGLPGPLGMRSRGRSSRPGSMSAEAAAPVTRGLADGMEDLLASPLPKPGLPMRVSAIPFRGDGKKAAVTVIIEIGGKGLSFAERGGRFTERVELAQLTIDSSAHADNGRSTALDLRLTKEELQGVQATGVRWVSRLDMKPGRYQLRVAARAQGSGQTGMVVHELEVPQFEERRVAMSGIALTSLPSVLMVTRGEAPLPSKIGTPPSAVRSYVRGDRVTALAEVYAPAAGELEVTARVEALDGRSKMRAAQRVATGAAKGPAPQASFTIPTQALAPGRYVLHLTAKPQSGDPAERRVPFEVIDAPK